MIVAVAFVALLSQTPAEALMQEIQRSHIEGNVPPAIDFDRLLKRDLAGYFKAKHGKLVQVHHEMLRDGPTQAGVAYPKFYLWVRVLDGASLVDQGAVRVAAVDRKEFQVTDFLSEAAIRADGGGIYSVFPAPVCDKIKQKLVMSTP